MAINILVSYALPREQIEVPLSVEEGCTVVMAIQRSGLLDRFPDIVVEDATVGIYGEKVSFDRVLSAGDRVEIYRPLLVDPKQARHLRSQ